MEYYLAIKMTDILPSATTWMDLECIMLSETPDRQRHLASYEWNLKIKQTKQNRNKLTDTENKLRAVGGEESGDMGKKQVKGLTGTIFKF